MIVLNNDGEMFDERRKRQRRLEQRRSESKIVAVDKRKAQDRRTLQDRRKKNINITRRGK